VDVSGIWNEKIIDLICDGLSVLSSMYEQHPDGSLKYNGTRPGTEWHGHGYFPRKIRTLQAGALKTVKVWKHRWIHVKTGQTQHSRPPDDIASVWFCSLIVVLSLHSYIESEQGIYNREIPLEALEDSPSERTIQRWMQRALSQSDQSMQALRRAVIERSEPRPVENIVRGGLSPPHLPRQRYWKQPTRVSFIRSGFTFLFAGAQYFDLPISILLAEARGRLLSEKTWLI